MVAESYLYTLNAMEDYLSHLNDGGMLGIVRISFDPPRENLKLVTSGATALRKLGITDPRDHIIVIRVNNFPYPTLSLFKLTPFTQEEWSVTANGLLKIPHGPLCMHPEKISRLHMNSFSLPLLREMRSNFIPIIFITSVRQLMTLPSSSCMTN